MKNKQIFTKFAKVMPHFLLVDVTILVQERQAKVTKNVFLDIAIKLDQTVVALLQDVLLLLLVQTAQTGMNAGWAAGWRLLRHWRTGGSSGRGGHGRHRLKLRQLRRGHRY